MSTGISLALIFCIVATTLLSGCGTLGGCSGSPNWEDGPTFVGTDEDTGIVMRMETNLRGEGCTITRNRAVVRLPSEAEFSTDNGAFTFTRDESRQIAAYYDNVPEVVTIENPIVLFDIHYPDRTITPGFIEIADESYEVRWTKEIEFRRE